MLRTVVILFYLVAADHVLADWEMVKQVSTVSFGTVKNETVSELHKFTEFKGLVRNSGLVRIEIDLLSVDTGIEIRDERMRSILFGDATRAVYKANMEMRRVTDVPIGESIEIDLDGLLELNDYSKALPLKVRVTHLTSGSYQVETVAANTIDLSSFGFTPGIEQLRSIAGLNAISMLITLEFNLVFKSLSN